MSTNWFTLKCSNFMFYGMRVSWIHRANVLWQSYKENSTMTFTGLYVLRRLVYWKTTRPSGGKLVLLDCFSISFRWKSITIELQWPDDAEEAERRIEWRSGEEGGSQQCDCRFTCHFKPSPDPIIESAYSSGYPSSSHVLISIRRAQDNASWNLKF